ncbi:hypothetical protein [Couchioplanes azureus]|uniref:hypothetical protein n=1 Tax=Couchioplanes caeruleus TaxID=56438 RepID=UPI00166FE7F3|nr:hypothetical protein [Couchioplanes caeruleus]GGQ52508.1 glycosyl transferase [Couchioplanes caeruleus subsp. azureus]
MVSPVTSERPQPADAAQAPAPSRWRRARSHLPAAGAYLGLALVVMGGYLADPAGRVSGHLASDNTWFQWLLSHGAYSVRHLSNPLFSHQQNAPDGVNMIANTSVLGVTLPMAPVTMLFGPRVAYFVWMVGALAGTAFSTYWVLRRYLVTSRVAAFLGGAFAGFAPGVVHHANGQPNFVSNFLLPLIVARVARLGLDGRWRRDGVILGLLVTYQLFLNEELLLITAVGCLFLTLGYAVLCRAEARRRVADFARALGLTAVVAGVLCAYPIWFQFNGPGSFSALPLFVDWGEDPLAYLTFARDTIAGTKASELTVGRTEQNSWFGPPLVLMLIVLAVVLWSRSVAARLAVVTGIAGGLLSLGPALRFAGILTEIPGPFAAMPEHMPVLGLLMPSRLTFVVIGATTVLLALGWEHLRWQAGPVPVARVLIALSVLPLVPKPIPARPDWPTPEFISSGAWRPYVKPGQTLVPVPLPSDWLGRETLSWSAEARHEFVVPEGYFLGPDPAGIGKMGPARASWFTHFVLRVRKEGVAPPLTDAEKETIRAEVRRWNGGVLVMKAEARYEPTRALVEQVYGPARQDRDVWIWIP